MSKYTTEVRYICETNTAYPIAGDGFDNIESIINASHSKIFNFNYPIFDNAYRATLETKILRHFYTREICDETVGLWKLRLCDRLNVIMPYYNQLYESALLKFNPFYDTDYTRSGNAKDNRLSVDSENETGNKTLANDVDKSSKKYESNETTTDKNKNEKQSGLNSSGVKSTTDDTYTSTGKTNKTDTVSGTSTNHETKTSSDSGSSTDKYSDTPQGSVANLANDTYLTNARMINKSNSGSDSVQGSVTKSEESSGTGSATNSGTNNTKYESNITGKDSRTITGDESVKTKDIGNELNKVKESGNASENYNKQGQRRGSVNNLNEYAEKVIGKMSGVSYSKMLNEFRSTFLNIDAMILKDLEPLFFGLW